MIETCYSHQVYCTTHKCYKSKRSRNNWQNLILATIEDVGWEIVRLILEIASGNKKAWVDYWGIENALCLFNPAPIT